MNTDLEQTSMAAVETTWLSPRFDRMNVLSEAIKVSPVFAQRDGWCFDDHDEKLYIDPEWTVLPVIWLIFTRLFYCQRDDRILLFFGGRNWSKQHMKLVFIVIIKSQVWLGHNFWNIGSHYHTNKRKKTAMRPWWRLQEKKEKGIFNFHPDWPQTYTPICSFKGGSHFLKAFPM